MEIKTTEEIIQSLGYCCHCSNNRSLISERNSRDKKWVAVDDLIKDIIKLENKRITDNNDYISIPIKDWLDFKETISKED